MNWFSGSIPDAVAEVKSQGKILLVFVEGEDELSKSMAVTYDNAEVSNKLNSKDCVALKLAVNSVPYQQFSQIYPVVIIPSSFFIGKNGLPIEIITGSQEPSVFITKIDKIFELNEESSNPVIDSTPAPNVQEGTEPKPEPMESSDSNTTDTVQNGCSIQPSTSQSENTSEANDASPSLEDKVNRAKSLLEARRQNKVIEEQEDSVSSRKNCISSLPDTESGRKRMKIEEMKEKKEEQERRKMGKALQQARQTRQENDLKQWVESRAKEKEEERLARERVRAQIAQDRAERAARYKQVTDEHLAAQKEKEMQRIKEEQERAVRNAAMRSTVARLQFRLPDGTSVTHQFPADSCLSEAKKFVIEEIRPSFSNFTLCTTFPRRQFTENDYSQTLRDLELAPSAALLVLPGTAITVASPSGGFFNNLFWMVVSPMLNVWRVVLSYFRSTFMRSEPATPREPQPGTSSTEVPNVKGDSNTISSKRPAAQKPPKQKFYQEGNVFRISNRQTDDDENNTWNGNSTQQM